MALKKVAPSSQWENRRLAPRTDTLVLAFDATGDQYYIARGEPADAHVVFDADDGQWVIDDALAAGIQRARIVTAGAAQARILE